MIALPLFVVLGGQGLFAFLLVVPLSPLRKLGITLGKFGNTSYVSITGKTLASCLVVLLLNALFNIYRIQSRLDKFSLNSINQGNLVDQVELLRNVLEGLLIGVCLILGFLLQQLHKYIVVSDSLKMNLEVLRKQAKGMESEYMRLTQEKGAGSSIPFKDASSEVDKKLLKLEADLLEKSQKLDLAEADVAAIKKQSLGLQLEYERLLEENDNLRSQLEVFDRQYSKSSNKKND